MSNEEIHRRLTEVFRRVLDLETLELTAATTANDVEGWDSLNHVTLVVSVEKEFGVRFTTREVNGLANVGDFISLIAQKLG